MTINQAAWKVDDADWMAARQAQWVDVFWNIKSRHVFDNNKKLFPAAEEYFLTGSPESLAAFSRSNDHYDIFIEMWLHADTNLDTFKQIAQKIQKNEHREGLQNQFTSFSPQHSKIRFKGISHYNGNDINMYQALFKPTLSEEYAHLKPDEIKDKALKQFAFAFVPCESFFEKGASSIYDFRLLTIPYWREVVKLGFHPGRYRALNVFIHVLDYAHAHREELDSLQQDFLDQIRDCFVDPSMPQGFLDMVEEVREKGTDMLTEKQFKTLGY